MSETGQRLFEGERLRLILFDRGCDRLVVTFDFRNRERTGFEAPQVLNTYKERGFDQLCVRVSHNDWFINSETDAVETLLSEVSQRYSEVVSLGFSMGAYGALRFAQPLRASRILAVSPQASIHPDIVPFETRYHADAGEFDLANGTLTGRGSDAEGILVIDPFDRRDMRHRDMIVPHFPRLKVLLLPFGGHPATSVLTSGKRAGTMVMSMLAETPDPVHMRRGHRNVRRQNAGYWQRFARQAEVLHPDWAQRARRKAQQIKANKG